MSSILWRITALHDIFSFASSLMVFFLFFCRHNSSPLLNRTNQPPKYLTIFLLPKFLSKNISTNIDIIIMYFSYVRQRYEILDKNLFPWQILINDVFFLVLQVRDPVHQMANSSTFLTIRVALSMHRKTRNDFFTFFSIIWIRQLPVHRLADTLSSQQVSPTYVTIMNFTIIKGNNATFYNDIDCRGPARHRRLSMSSQSTVAHDE